MAQAQDENGNHLAQKPGPESGPGSQASGDSHVVDIETSATGGRAAVPRSARSANPGLAMWAPDICHLRMAG